MCCLLALSILNQNSFIGTWRLVAANFYKRDGTLVQLYGADPLGYIRYDEQGRMSVQIMQRNRPILPKIKDVEKAFDAYKAILRGYVAYFGTYSVDEIARTMTHHIQASLVPEWVGTDLVRTYEFSGNRLILRTPPAQLRGEMMHGELIWERFSNE